MKLLRLFVAVLYALAFVTPLRARAEAKAESQQWDYALTERVKMALIVLTPTGKILDYSSNAVVSSVAPVLVENTNLVLDNITDSSREKEVRDCKGSLRCFVGVIRQDYEPTSPRLHQEDDPTRLKPWSEVRRILNENPTKPERLLAVLSSVHQTDGSDRLSAVLIDTDAALDFIHRANDRNERNDAKKEEELEDRIAQYAVRASPPPERVSKAEEIDRVLYKWFAEDFKQVFEEAGHWNPYGSIEIICDQPDMEISIDGESVGRTKAGKTTIGRVTPRDRLVRLTKPEFLASEARVSVVRGQASTATLTALREPREGVRVTRKIVFWTGVAAAVAGAAITALAVQRQSASNQFVLCLSSESKTDCKGSEFLKFPDSGRVGFEESLTKDGGIPLAALGYSMAGAGAFWALSTTFINDEETMPWLEIGGGAVIFLASFIISALADGTNAVQAGKEMHP